MNAAPLRILHVIPSMGYGGAERQAAYLAHGLRALGHDVHFALFAGGENLALLEASGATVHLLRPAPNHDPRRFLELLRLTGRVAPALVQTWLPMANVLGALAALRIRAPWVVAERYTPAAYERSLKVGVEQWLTRRFAAVVVSNSSEADRFWAAELPPERPHQVIRNALPLAELDAVAPADPVALGLPPDLPLVVYVGRMLPHKGIETLLDALEQVGRVRPVAVLLLGVGALHEAVQARLRAPGFAGRALAPGFRHDVAAWLKRAAVFVSLSRFEGMPNTVMEAMATRTPCVVSDIPQHREILDPGQASFVALDDVPAAAAAVLEVLEDPVRAAERARRARAAAEAWSIPATASAWAALYRRLVP